MKNTRYHLLFTLLSSIAFTTATNAYGLKADLHSYTCSDPSNPKGFIFDDSFESFKHRAVTVSLEQNILNKKDAKVATLTLSANSNLPQAGTFNLIIPLSGVIEYTQPITQYLYVKKDSTNNQWGLYLSQANTPADIINRIKNNPITLLYTVTDKPIKRPYDPTTLEKTTFNGQKLVMHFSRENPDPTGSLGLHTDSHNPIFTRIAEDLDGSNNVISRTFSILQPLTLTYPSTGQQTVYLNPNSQVEQIDQFGSVSIPEPLPNGQNEADEVIYNYLKDKTKPLQWVTPIENQPFSLFTLEKATCSYYSQLILGAEVPAPTPQSTNPTNPTTPKWKIKSAIEWGPKEVPVDLEKAKKANQPIATLPIPYQDNKRPGTYADLNPTLYGDLAG